MSTGPRRSEIADFEPIFGRSASTVTPIAKSSINTNRKSTTCFPISLRWSSYVALKPPNGAKTQNGCFRCKIALRLKNVCYKVSLCENCQRQSCKAVTICNQVHAKVHDGYQYVQLLTAVITPSSHRLGLPYLTVHFQFGTRSTLSHLDSTFWLDFTLNDYKSAGKIDCNIFYGISRVIGRSLDFLWGAIFEQKVVVLKTQAKTAKLTIPMMLQLSLGQQTFIHKIWVLASPGGGALTTYTYKLRPQIFFLRPGGARALSAFPGYYVYSSSIRRAACRNLNWA